MDYYKKFTKWVLENHRSVFLIADISKDSKIEMLRDMGYSSDVLAGWEDGPPPWVAPVKKSEERQECIDDFATALGMCRISVDNMTAEIIFETYKKVVEMGGNFTLRDASQVVVAVNEKYKKKDT